MNFNLALENPDAKNGLWAPDLDAYDVFSELFDAFISQYHAVNLLSFKYVRNFGDSHRIKDLDKTLASNIVSTRVRVGRSLVGYPLSPKITRKVGSHFYYKEESVGPFCSCFPGAFGDRSKSEKSPVTARRRTCWNI